MAEHAVTLEPGLTLHVEVDDFADPWAERETVVLLHGFAESGRAWFAWVPHLARRYRVVRPDLRGFGASSVPPDAASRTWSPQEFAADIAGVLDALEIDRAHVVGARVGCAVGIALAAADPARVATLSLVSGLARGAQIRGLRNEGAQVGLDDFAERIRAEGTAAWFARTGRSRLGSAPSEAQVAWWSELMAGTDEGACIGMMRAAAQLDLYPLLGQVQAPTLVLAAQDSAVQDIEATREWQRRIPGSTLEAFPGDSPHLAATHADECAARVLAFMVQP
jgi:pimeloyl-ACP methyl ester carboxylesterase